MQEDEIGDRDMASTAVESAVGGGFAALATALANAHPGMAVAIAGVASGLDVWFPTFLDRVFARRRRSVLLTTAAASYEAEIPLDELLNVVGDDGARQMFVGDVIDASARSDFDPKLLALGRALAKGVLSPDEIVFQQEVQFVRTLARLEAPHIRVLEVISKGVPQGGMVKRALVQGWEISDVAYALPEFGEFVVQLVAVLAGEGLINDSAVSPVQGPQFLITGNGRELLERVLSATEATRQDRD